MGSPVAEGKAYASAGAALNKKALVPMFVAMLIMAIVGGLPQQVLMRVHLVLMPLGAALTQVLMSLFTVSYLNMAIRLRKGEQVAIGDIFKFGEFLVPALMLGLPAAAVSLTGYLALVVGIFGLIAMILGIVVSIALAWAPLEMATRKNLDFKACWMASVNFWKTNPVGILLTSIICGIFCLVFGWLIFAGGAAACAFVMFYTDKTGQQPFTEGAAMAAAAPPMAAAPK